MIGIAEMLLWLVGCIVCIVAITFAGFSGYLFYVHRKYCHIPGPPLQSFFFGHIPIFKKLEENGQYRFQILIEWAEEYGPLFKIYMVHICMLIPSSEAIIKELLTKRMHPKPAKAYKMFHSLCGERFLGTGVVASTDHDEWAVRRKALNPAFHRSALRSMMLEFNELGDYWTDRLQMHAGNGDVINMDEMISKLTLDGIGKVGFGVDFGGLDDKKGSFIDAFKIVVDGLNTTLQDPLFAIKWSERHKRRKISSTVRSLREYSTKIINTRLQNKPDYLNNNGTADILTQLIKNHEGSPYLEMIETVDDFLTIFFGGQETISHTLAFMLCTIGRDPDVLEQVQNEIDTEIGDAPTISYEDLGRLEYLGRVIKETLRLYPVVPITMRDVVHEQEIEGFKIPAGSLMMMNFYQLHRLDAHFEDPLRFDPDRWLEAQPLYAYMPFSLGSRTCIGKQFAQIELKLLLCKFLQSYQYSLVPDQSFDVNALGFLRPKGGAKVTIKHRDT